MDKLSEWDYDIIYGGGGGVNGYGTFLRITCSRVEKIIKSIAVIQKRFRAVRDSVDRDSIGDGKRSEGVTFLIIPNTTGTTAMTLS